MLTPYEAMVALGRVPGWWEAPGAREACTCGGGGGQAGGGCGSKGGSSCGCASGACGAYPMDYYARDGGPWNSSWHKPRATPPAA